jgi:hypothetical protein
LRIYLQITREKGTGGMAQVVEHLLSKCKALNLNPSPGKKEGREGEREERKEGRERRREGRREGRKHIKIATASRQLTVSFPK